MARWPVLRREGPQGRTRVGPNPGLSGEQRGKVQETLSPKAPKDARPKPPGDLVQIDTLTAILGSRAVIKGLLAVNLFTCFALAEWNCHPLQPPSGWRPGTLGSSSSPSFAAKTPRRL